MKPLHGLIVLGAALPCFVECVDQPKPNCITSPAPFAMKLIEVSREESAPGACDDFGPDSFNADPEVGIASYYARDDKGQPDYDKGSVAIQTAEVGNLVFTAEGAGEPNQTGGPPYSVGPYAASEPDDADFCAVNALTPTHVVLPELPEIPDDPETEEDDSVPGQPAVDITLEWTRLRVYVTAASYGTQVAADLKDTRVTDAGDTCTIQYKAIGLSPAVPCMLFDDDGAPIVDPDTGLYEPDEAACEPEPDPENGRPVGSGISPNTRYTCDTTIGFCTLDGETVPALR